MKNKLTLNRNFVLLAAFFVLTLSTCKKDGRGNNSIIGTWTSTMFGSKNVINQYQFKSDGSFEYKLYQIDTVTKKVIGYETRYAGNYKLALNTTLTFTNVKYYVNPTYDFGPLTALTLIDGPANSTQTIALNAFTNQLSFYFDCPINANCVPSPIVYHRQ